MPKKLSLLIIALVFILGFLVGDVLSYVSIQNGKTASPVILGAENAAERTQSVLGGLFSSRSQERDSPNDRIKESDIHVYQDRVVINIENPLWATFTDTNSMDPVLDKGAYAIQIQPKDSSELIEGDIISYEPEFFDGVVIHRIVKIDYDENGWYCIAKGDNNPSNDPGKIRFEQIRRVLVGILY